MSVGQELQKPKRQSSEAHEGREWQEERQKIKEPASRRATATISENTDTRLSRAGRQVLVKNVKSSGKGKKGKQMNILEEHEIVPACEPGKDIGSLSGALCVVELDEQCPGQQDDGLTVTESQIRKQHEYAKQFVAIDEFAVNVAKDGKKKPVRFNQNIETDQEVGQASWQAL